MEIPGGLAGDAERYGWNRAIGLRRLTPTADAHTFVGVATGDELRGRRKALWSGPREVSRLTVALVECSGAMSTRLPVPEIDGQLLVADDGGLAFSRTTGSTRVEFTSGGAHWVTAAEAADPDVVLAPRDFAELGGWFGWIGRRRRSLACSFEVVLAPAGSADRAVFRMMPRSDPSWFGVFASNTGRTRYEDVWEVFAFVETLQRRRAQVGLTPLPFRGVVNESSWRHKLYAS